MNQPSNQQFHNFASDVSMNRPEIRDFVYVSNYLLSIHWKNSKRIIQWLHESHPGFVLKLQQVLPRLDGRSFYV